MTLAPVQLPLGVQLRESATLTSLVAGNNAQALAAVAALAEGAATANLYLWAATGAGKSHILQAASRSAANADQRTAYLPLRDLCQQSPAVLDGLHTMDMLCLDELEAVAGQRPWEEALVGLFDHCRLAGGKILAAGRAAPKELGLTLNDLSSRLGWGAVYALQDLEDADKCRVLRNRAAQRGLQMPVDVADFVLRRASRDLPSLLATLDRLDHASLAAQRRLTIPFVKQVLQV